jgi:hypothetical protein
MRSMRDRATQALRLDELEGRFDPWLLGIALVLAGLGVVMVASSSMPYAMSNGAGPFHYLQRHLVFLSAGLVLAMALMRTEVKRIEKHSHFLLLMCFVLLAMVWVPGIGKAVNGARRWLNLAHSQLGFTDAGRLGGDVLHRDVGAVPRSPPDLVQQPMGRCAGQRLSAGTSVDRDRPWRPDRGWLGRQHPQARLLARGAHRFHLRGDR